MSKKNDKDNHHPSSISTKNGVFDYGKCLFEVRLNKKGLFGQQTRHLYCTNNSIIITKEPYQKKPDKILFLKADWKVEWIYDQKKLREPIEKKIVGFKILADIDLKIEFFGDTIVMMTLRDYFSKQLFQIKFLDEYEIQKKIGKGKYAKVYKVRRKDNNQLFAVKYLHKNKLATIEDANSALFNELKILRLINHQNCIQLIATYEDENGYYILTELLDSEKSLQGELQKHSDQQLGYQIVKNILKQLIKGIEYVHSLGIMHRDLKPQNIMFANNDPNSSSNLKIIDFGLAQFIEDPHYIYVHVGTPGYVAPEILSNESDKHRYNEKCDLFSIGVVFHILLTGRSVFPGKRFSQVLQANKECKVELKGPKYDELDRNAIDLLARLLEPNPQIRISSREALIHPFFTASAIKINKTVPPPPVNPKIDSVVVQILPVREPEPIFRAGNKLSKGFHNLNKISSIKDFDTIQINFNELNQRMINMVSISQIQLLTKTESRLSLYLLTQDLVDTFVMLEENQTDDLSFFASPLKPRCGLKNNLAELSVTQRFETTEQDDEGNPVPLKSLLAFKGMLQTEEVSNYDQIYLNLAQNKEIVSNSIKQSSKDPQFTSLKQNGVELNGVYEQDKLKIQKGDFKSSEQDPNDQGPVEREQLKLMQSIKQNNKQADEDEERKDEVKDILPLRMNKQESNQISDKEEPQRKMFPKRLMKLLSLFPIYLLEKDMEGDLKKEGKQTVQILGKFLLVGYNNNNNNNSNNNNNNNNNGNSKLVTDQYLQEVLSTAKKTKLLEEWFINLVSEMINPIIDLVPDFLYLKAQLDKYLIASIPKN